MCWIGGRREKGIAGTAGREGGEDCQGVDDDTRKNDYASQLSQDRRRSPLGTGIYGIDGVRRKEGEV